VQQKAETRLPSYIPQVVHLPITTGAIFIFWTWLCLAFSDVGAYFVGKKFGKTKLGTVAPAAGAASPNKTIEGVIGGCALSAALGMLGAWVQKWPLWALTGAVHGVILGLLGLLGDLTASMLKRDGGLKDFGDILPVRSIITIVYDGSCILLFALSPLFRRNVLLWVGLTLSLSVYSLNIYSRYSHNRNTAASWIGSIVFSGLPLTVG
jgi:predicted CDP-diglyceride synthetase/phosphatidate cytidylyltransferase